MDPRYARQEALSGWDQQRLADATIAISGSGPTAFLSGLMATAMGFGRLILLGGESLESVGLSSPREEPWSWADLFSRINPQVRVYSGAIRLRQQLLARLPALDGLIVAGNDMRARQAGWQLARETSIPVVAGSASGRLGLWGPATADAVAMRFSDRSEPPLLSQIIAALLVEDLRKALLPLPDEAGRADQPNLLSLPESSSTGRARYLPLSSSWRGIALIGAGALGTWFGLGLGLAGLAAALSIYDDDEIDETNLNRQILFYEAVGQPKAPVLAARLQELFPRLKVSGYGVRATADNSQQLLQATVLSACPDNFQARALLNRLARRHDRVLLSGGTSAVGGSCILYEPGRSACLSCRLNIDQLAEQEEDPESCTQQVEASVVTSNAIIGALMVWTLKGMMAGRTETGMWEYDGRAQNTRLGRRSARPACTCHTQ